MKALFLYLQSYILANVTGVKSVDLYRGQDLKQGRRTHKGFKFPAVFIEFEVEEVFPRVLGVRDISLIVRFRFAIKGYKWTRLDDLTFKEEFDFAVNLLRGNPSNADGVYFSSFEELVTEWDDEPATLNEPIVEYRTLYRDNSAYKRKNWTTTKPTSIEVTREILS